MTQDDRMETITDPAEIRATDEPDEITTARYRALMATPLDGPMMRGETTPAPASGAGLDLDALHETICDNFTGMAEVRQAADLLVAEVRRLRQDIDECWVPLYHDTKHERDQATARAEAAEAEVGTLRDTLARRTDSHTQLVRENEALRAKVAEGRRIVGMLAEAVESECEDDPEMCHEYDRTDDGRCPLLVDLNRAHAALAVTTGEGE